MTDSIQEQLQRFSPVRILAFGSSNTERAGHSEGQYNWFDWLDLALREARGRLHHSINVGISGETTSDLLNRFEQDVVHYQPHVVLLTVGGNDSNPERQIDRDTFYRQLLQLVQRIQSLPDCMCVLQTYYSAVEEDLDQNYFEQFHAYMQVVRDVASEEGVSLIDNLERWERLRLADRGLHKTLMRDAMHVKPLGNMLWGMDVARSFGIDVRQIMHHLCHEALTLQSQIDKLGTAHVR